MRLEDLNPSAGGRLMSPSAERNKEPIAQVLLEVLPTKGVVLEIGSGTGQHVVHFARAMPGLTWQPSERDAECLRSITGWVEAEALPNVRQAVRRDVHDPQWMTETVDAVVSINMIHIAPWSATDALLSGASVTLRPAGLLCLYGPFRKQGKHTSASNRAFHDQLRSENPDWGIRDLEEVEAAASAVGLKPFRTFEMPANNLTVVFRRDETRNL